MSMVPFDGDITRCIKWLQQNAPNIQSLINNKAQWYAKYNQQFWEQWEANVFDLRTANNFGLMVWAIILGVPAGGLGLYPNVAAFAFGSERENFISSDKDEPNPSTGGNFYGAGQTAVGSIEEIRKLLQLRYVALTSRGNIAQTNRMLKFIFNKDEPWDFPSGKYFYVMDVNGTPKVPAPVTDLSIYRNDWQGNVELSSSPRTNLVGQGVIPGAASSAWDDSKCLLGFASHWQGMVGTRILATAANPQATDSLFYGKTGGFIALPVGVYNITAFYQPGSAGRIRIGVSDSATGNFYGFSGVIGSTLSNVSSDTSKAVVALSSDVLFDQTNGVRRLRMTITVRSALNSACVAIGPNTTLNDKDVILYGVDFESGSDFNGFITTPSNFQSRASSGSYYDENGVMFFAQTNVARVDSYGANQSGDLVNIGLIMEPESTNLVTFPVSVSQLNITGNSSAAPMAVVPHAGIVPTLDMNLSHVMTLEAASPQVVIAPIFATPVGKAVSASLFFAAGDTCNFVSVRMYGVPNAGGASFGIEASFDLTNGVVSIIRKIDGIETPNITGVWASIESAGVRDGKQLFRCSFGATPGAALDNGFNVIQYIPVRSPIGISSYQQRSKGDDVYVWHFGGITVESGHYPSTLIEPEVVFASRGSVASYIDNTGLMKYQAANTLRSGVYGWNSKNALVLIGDLTEDSSSQLLPNSDNMSSWQLNNATTSIEATASVAPTGDKMQHLIDNQTSGIHSIGAAIQTQSLGYYCGSVYVSRNGIRYVALVIGLDTNDCASVVLDTQTWKVVSVRNSPSSVLRCVNFGVIPSGPGIYRLFVATQCPANTTSLSFNIMCANNSTQWPPVYSGSGTGVYVWGAQAEPGVYPSSYISNTSNAVPLVRAADVLTAKTVVRAADVPSSTTAVTDFTVTDATNGKVSFGQPPLSGSGLSWTGKWNGATQNVPMNFGKGDGVTSAYVLSEPLSLTSPTSGPFKLEYRVGPNMGLSSQLVNLMNDETMELLPRTAGVKATVIQEN